MKTISLILLFSAMNLTAGPVSERFVGMWELENAERGICGLANLLISIVDEDTILIEKEAYIDLYLYDQEFNEGESIDMFGRQHSEFQEEKMILTEYIGRSYVVEDVWTLELQGNQLRTEFTSPGYREVCFYEKQ